jgi:hypothetical protein
MALPNRRLTGIPPDRPVKKENFMTVYLNVFSRFDATKGGVLEIRYFVLNGQEIRTYEFIGSGSPDGGSWEWISGADRVEAHLTSNIRQSKAAILQSTNWGQLNPPSEPWFSDPKESEGNTLLYFMVNGRTEKCDWNLKK